MCDDLGGFGDARLRRIGGRLLAALQDQPTLCLQALAESRNEAVQFGRFLDNEAVSADEMLVQAARHCSQRAAGRHVLAIQDTTELHFATHRASKRGFGAAGNGHDIGLFLHPVLAVDAQSGGIIGLVGAQVMNRTDGPAADRRRRDAEAKESRRWLAGAEQAVAALDEAAMLTVVADSESDVYDQFARRPQRVHLLSRAAQDRCLEGGGRLFGAVASWPEQDRYAIALPQRGARPARSATVALRFGELTLKRPARAARSLAASVTLRVVDATEIDPPPGEEPIRWCLLTTHTLGDVGAARQIIAWYRARWTIEQVFRTLKSAALQAEASQVSEARRFIKLVVAGLIAAVRVMQIVLARDGSTGQPLSDAADPAEQPMLTALNARLEGRTGKLRNPHPPTSLAWFAWIIARLGGWSGYTSKGYKPPGPKTIARGLHKLDAISNGWKLARSGLV